MKYYILINKNCFKIKFLYYFKIDVNGEKHNIFIKNIKFYNQFKLN